MTSKVSARARRVRWAVAVCSWMTVTLFGCSGGDEEYPWPWQDEEPPAPAADFAGMWDFDPARGFATAEGSGFLFIEEPCVYMVEDINEPHDPLRRIVVSLPEDYTRYDPQTQSIWVFTDGPFIAADLVISPGAFGGADRELLATCPAQDRFTAPAMELCATSSPDQC